MSLKTKSEQSSVVFISFLGALLLTVLVCFLLSFVPNELDTDMITSSFVPSLDNFVAETSEKLQFIFGTVTFVVSYFLIGNAVNRAKTKFSFGANNAGAILLILLMGLCVYTLSTATFFTDSLPKALRTSFTVFALLLLVFYALAKHIPLKDRINRLLSDKKKLLNLIPLAIGLISIVAVSSFFLRDTYFYGAYTVEHHTDAYFYPIWKVWSGQYPLVDFSSLYGFYPYFFIAIMFLLGGVSIKNFSIVITLLVAVVFLALFYTLWSVCKRKIFSLLGILSIEYILIMYNTEISADFYLQYLPHRMITLCVILAICCVYIKRKARQNKSLKAVEICGWICSGAALLWNLDTGVVVWLGWAIYLCFIHLLDNSLFCKSSWFFILKTVAKAIITALISFSLLLLLTFVLSGEWVSFKDIFWGQGVFYGSGFFMIRMQLFHPWMIIIFAYAIALAISLSLTKDLSKTKDFDYIKTAMLFMFAVVGVGAFLYFQGRSHDLVFVVVVWPAISLAAVFLDGLPLLKQDKLPLFAKATHIGWRVALLSLLLTFSFGWFHNMLSPNFLVDLKSKESVGVSGVETEISVVNKSGISPEKLDLLTSLAAETYEHFGVRYMPRTQAEVDIFSYEDIQKINDYLKVTDKNVILSAKTREHLLLNNAAEFSSVVDSRFTTAEIDGYLICYLK